MANDEVVNVNETRFEQTGPLNNQQWRERLDKEAAKTIAMFITLKESGDLAGFAVVLKKNSGGGQKAVCVAEEHKNVVAQQCGNIAVQLMTGDPDGRLDAIMAVPK